MPIQDSFSKINKHSVSAFKQYLSMSGASPKSIKRKMSSLRKFTNWAEKEGLIKKDSLEKKKQKRRLVVSHRAYHALPYFTYLNFLILIVFGIALGFGVYRQFIVKTKAPLAYPNQPIAPKRYLSFQGRLTNANNTPITNATSVTFKLYNTAGTGSPPAGGIVLWNSGACSIDPDQDGIFNTVLGSDCGSEIATSVFTENQQVWLEITVVAEVMDPRIQIATVAYALNSETLQGFPVGSLTNGTPEATMGATARTIPAINPAGNLVIAAASPTLWSTSGTFSVKGQVLSIVTNTGTNGNITLAPDGSGLLNLTLSAGTGHVINTTDANLGASGGKEANTLYYGKVQSTSTNYNLLKLESGSSPTPKFTIDSSGNASMAGALNVLSTISANTTGTINGVNINSGTISNATWNGVAIGTTYGGTGQNFGSTAQGSIIYFSGSGAMAALGTGTAGYVLTTQGTSANPSWTDPGSVGTNYWNQTLGALYPKISSVDLLIGGSSTSSAKFAFTNVLTGTPTATFSGNLVFAGGARTITATNMNSLTIGDSSTQNVIINPNGNVGIGTTNPNDALDVVGNINTSTYYELGNYKILDGSYSNKNIMLGYGITTPTSTENVVIGYQAGYTGVAQDNVLVGPYAGYYATGSYNSFIGDGSGAGVSSYEGNENTAVGYESLYKLSTGGFANSSFGAWSGWYLSTGDYNVFIGDGSGFYTTTGSNNTYIGGLAGGDSENTGSNNIFLGYQTGENSSGSNNLIIGYNIEAPIAAGSNQMSIGNLIFGTGINGTGTTISSGNVGIGTSNPTQRLDISGNATISGTLALGPNAPSYAGTCNASAKGKQYFDGTDNTMYYCNGTSWTSMAAGGAGSGFWQRNLGALSPGNIADDVLIGGTATSSAKFAFLNNWTGIPTATFSGNLVLASTAGTTRTIGATNMNPLTLGTATTGNLQFFSASNFITSAGNLTIIGAITAATSTNTINNIIISSGAVSSVTTLSMNNQLTNSYANTAALNLTGAGAGITFGSSGPYQIITGGSTHLALMPGGNVGIGTTAPTAKLDVAGDASVSGNLYLNANAEIRPMTNGSLSLDYKSGVNAWTKALTVDNTGNVGIGLTNPSSKFEVNGNIEADSFIDTSSSSYYLNPGAGASLSLAGYATMSGSLAVGYSSILAGTGNAAFAGSVGIGTTNPQAPLDVNGDIYTSSGISTFRTAVSNGTMEATKFCTGDGETNCVTDFSSVGVNYWSQTLGALYPQNSTVDLLIGGTATSSAKFAFTNVLTGTPTATFSGNLVLAGGARTITATNMNSLTIGDSSTQNVIINPNGNVGIGTTNPTEKLVIGDDLGDVGSNNWIVVGGSGDYPGLALGTDNDNYSYSMWQNSVATLRMGTKSGSTWYETMAMKNGNVGIGTESPGSKLAVSGNAVIGSGYATSAGPTDGLAIQGNVGIGTTGPSSKLALVGQDVANGITLDSGGVNLYAGSGAYGGILRTDDYFNAPAIGIGTVPGSSELRIQNGSIVIRGAASTTDVYNSIVSSGDTVTRFTIDTSGKMQWGSGTATQDTNLYRSAADTLRTEDSFIVDGNVGIGLTNPSSKLEVNGSIEADSFIDTSSSSYYLNPGAGASLSLAGYATMAASLALGPTDAPAGPGHLKATGTITGERFTDYTNSSYFLDPAAAPSLNLAGYATAGASLAVGYSSVMPGIGNAVFSGSVGIGTTSPVARLDVRTTGATNVNIANFLQTNSGTGNQTYIYLGQSLATGRATGFGFTDNTDATSSYTWITNYGDAADTGGLTIKKGGNVGIGTASPEVKLDIYDGASHTLALGTSTNLVALPQGGGKGTSGAPAGNYPLRLFESYGWNFTLQAAADSGFRVHPPGNTSYTETPYFVVKYGGNVGIGTTNPLSKLSIGGVGSVSYALWATGDYGVYSYATSISGIGVYASGSGTSGVGVYASGTATGVKGSGDTYDFYAQGTGADYGTSSSLRWKRDLRPIDNALDKVLALRGLYYTWDEEHGGKHGMGMIAEEVGQYVPEVVGWENDGSGYATGMDYGHLTPMLVEAIKEQQIQIASLSDQLAGMNLTETGDLEIISNDSNFKLVKSPTGEIIERISAFSKALIANLKAGFIETKELLAENITSQKLISPVIETEEIRFKNDDLRFKNKEGETVVSVDQDGKTTHFGDLLVKGDVYTESLEARSATITGTLYADQIQAREIIGLESKFGNLMADKVSTNTLDNVTQDIKNMINNLFPQQENLGTEEGSESANLADQASTWPVTDPSQDLEIKGNVRILGMTSTASLSVAGTFSQDGTFIIDDGNSINVVGGTLFLQSLGLGGVDILAGKVVVDVEGNVQIAGNLAVEGEISSSRLALKEKSPSTSSGFGTLFEVKNKNDETVASIDASGSAFFAQVGTKKVLVATAEATPSSEMASSEITTNATAGKATLSAYETEITIKSPFVTDNTLIYVTPISSTQNKVLYVKAKQAVSEQESGWFKVGFDMAINQPVEFNWWIIN